jgi:hypothetical protein
MPANICRFAEYELDRLPTSSGARAVPVQLQRIPLDVLFILADRCGQTGVEVRKMTAAEQFVDRAGATCKCSAKPANRH